MSHNVDFGSYWSPAAHQSSDIFYDVKILYDLEGQDTNNFIALANSILGTECTRRYRECVEKYDAFKASYVKSGINPDAFPLKKLWPDYVLIDAEKERKSLIQQLFDNAKEKEFYLSFFPALKALWEISQQPVHINAESIKEDQSHYSTLIQCNTESGKLFLHFNPVGAKTGRLSFVRGTVNFYILPKNLRKCLVAPPDYNIVQLDFKSFQPRLAIFCTDSDEFKSKFSNIDDIYSVFPGNREENKLSFISWMFSNRKIDLFEKEASPILDLRKKLYNEAKSCGKLTTKFGRHIYYNNEEENVVLQNYVTANEVDATLSLLVDVHEMLKNTRSRIIFSFHDSLVLYVHKEEMSLVKDIKDKMENENSRIFNTKFPVSVKFGSDFENLNDYAIAS